MRGASVLGTGARRWCASLSSAPTLIASLTVHSVRVLPQAPLNAYDTRVVTAVDLQNPSQLAASLKTSQPQVVLVRQSHLPSLAAALSVSATVESLALPAGADSGSITELLPSGQAHTDNSLIISAQSASKITMKDLAESRQAMRELSAAPEKFHVAASNRSIALPPSSTASSPKPVPLTSWQVQCIQLSCAGRWDELMKLITAEQDRSTAPLKLDFEFPNNSATAMHHAAADDAVEVLDFLLDRGADINAQALNGSSPLHWAAGAGKLAACKLLLQRGAIADARSHTWTRSVFGKGSGQTPLHWAAESAHLDCVALLADHCPLLSAETDERRKSPLQLATESIARVTSVSQSKAGRDGCIQLLTEAELHPYVAIEIAPVFSATTSLKK